MTESRKDLTQQDSRKERLAAALRENLKRRKAQSRERRVNARTPDGDDPSEPKP